MKHHHSRLWALAVRRIIDGGGRRRCRRRATLTCNAGARDREQREHLSPRRYAWLVVKSSLGLRVAAKHHPSRLWALVVRRVVGAGGRRRRRGRATVTCSAEVCGRERREHLHQRPVGVLMYNSSSSRRRRSNAPAPCKNSAVLRHSFELGNIARHARAARSVQFAACGIAGTAMCSPPVSSQATRRPAPSPHQQGNQSSPTSVPSPVRPFPNRPYSRRPLGPHNSHRTVRALRAGWALV